MSDAGYATRHLSRGAIGGIFAGDVEAALARGCDAYRAAFTAAIPARRPVVIVSAGGAPRDGDLVAVVARRNGHDVEGYVLPEGERYLPVVAAAA